MADLLQALGTVAAELLEEGERVLNGGAVRGCAPAHPAGAREGDEAVE